MLRSLRSRLLLAFLLPTLALFAVAGAAGYALTRRILEDELGASLSRVAASAAAELNAERLLTIEPGDDVDGTRTWRNLVRSLEAVKEASGTRRIFVVDTARRVLLDVGGGVPVGTELPDLARDRAEVARALGGERSASSVLFEGSDGLPYKAGYAPVRAGDRVVALVGVEGTTGFFRPLRRLFVAYLALVVAGLVVLGGVALWTARTVARPLNRLEAAALRIGGGDLATPVAAQGVREIRVLAQELEAMRRALEGRDRQLKMMLAGVAHEVRNPIGGIELFAGVLQEELGPAQAEAQEHVARIRAELEYLRRIVEEFLAFAREDRLHPAPVDAATLLENVREVLRAEAERRGVQVQVAAEAATLQADVTLLTSAVSNLVKNAVQASPHQGVVQLRGQRQDGLYRIEVRDAGQGIAPEHLEQIFEPFFTTREKGTGLGLALARKLVQAHGGKLTVRSAPGDTVFTVLLPRGGADGGGPR